MKVDLNDPKVVALVEKSVAKATKELTKAHVEAIKAELESAKAIEDRAEKRGAVNALKNVLTVVKG